MMYRTALRLMGRHAWATPALSSDPLRDMAADASRRWPGIRHLPTAEAATQLALRPDRIVLLDVRKPDEFAVSRLEGAQLCAPGAMRAPWGQAIALRPQVELVLFYCAVGVRSSTMAERWRREADGQNIVVANLSGGLFRWANECRPLFDDQGPTNAVHPFNRHWGQFLSTQVPKTTKARF
jgi:rhodanese-related sulfurtransferase